MNTIKIIFNTIIGYTGSSESPDKMSMRFTAIIIAVIAKVATIAAIAGYTIPLTDAQSQGVAASLAFVIAAIMWVYGLIRAVYVALKTRNLGVLYGR